jgi:hypothetical protein
MGIQMTCHEGLRYQLALARFMDRGIVDFSGDWYKWLAQQWWVKKSWLNDSGFVKWYNERHLQDGADAFINQKRVEYVTYLDVIRGTECSQSLAGAQGKPNSGNNVGNIQAQPANPGSKCEAGVGYRIWFASDDRRRQ